MIWTLRARPAGVLSQGTTVWTCTSGMINHCHDVLLTVRYMRGRSAGEKCEDRKTTFCISFSSSSLYIYIYIFPIHLYV